MIKKMLEKLKKVLTPYKPSKTPYWALSFPKSGRTWFRVLVAKAIALHFNCPKQIVLDSIEVIRSGCRKAPWLVFSHAQADHPIPADRYPEAFNEVVLRYSLCTKKVLLLVRDPRDVLISYYYHLTSRQKQFDGSLSEFIRDPSYGTNKVIFALNVWYQNKSRYSDFLMIRYEDLHKRPHEELKKILRFLDLSDVSEATIKEAVNYASFENMRRLVFNQEAKKSPFYSRIAPTNPDDPESFKVRKGKVGGYQEYLTPEDLEYVNDRVRSKLLPVFGYQ